MTKIRWGVLSTANIGVEKVLPAMQRGAHCEVTAIASRDLAKAQAAAEQLGIPKAYGSYEELLADPEIDAIYNPLPNHLHVPWSIKALEAGKHVLCEKPIALTTAEAQTLADAAEQHPQLKVMEAFMYRHHPQWQRARQIVAEGGIGELRTIQSIFSYYNTDPDNIRNQADIGGGGLMDIGCYNISISRFIFGAEPQRVCGIVEYDPQFKTDRLASGMLDFGQRHGHVHLLDAAGIVPARAYLRRQGPDRDRDTVQRSARPAMQNLAPARRHIDEIVFDVCDQYTLQGDALARAILDDTPVPTPIEDAVANMAVIEALVRSSKSGALGVDV